jgi:hypothetical protein
MPNNQSHPGEKGTGEYYRIVVRDSEQFKTFRNHDVGDPGGIERIAGQRKDGSWDTQAWLIDKDRAEAVDDTLKAKDQEVQEVLDELGSKPKHYKGDIYKAEPGSN